MCETSRKSAEDADSHVQLLDGIVAQPEAAWRHNEYNERRYSTDGGNTRWPNCGPSKHIDQGITDKCL